MFQTNVVGKIKTNILCQVTIFSENRAIYELMWGKKMLQPENVRDSNTTERTSIAYWTTKAIHTYSEYPTLIAFSRQQWSRERASMLRIHVDYLPCLDA
jgi:hypothetical protein